MFTTLLLVCALTIHADPLAPPPPPPSTTPPTSTDAPPPAPAPTPTTASLLESASQLMSQGAYGAMLTELAPVLTDANATDDDKLRANMLAGVAHVMLEQNDDARATFDYVFDHDAHASLPADTPPEAAAFYTQQRDERFPPPKRAAPLTREEIDEATPSKPQSKSSKAKASAKARATLEGPSTSSVEPHMGVVTGGFEAGSWYYGLDGGGVGDSSIAATLVPGLRFAGDVFPLASLDVPWLGMDAELALSSLPFHISGGELALTPAQLHGLFTRGALVAEGRASLAGFGVIGRLGYRYEGMTIEPQSIALNGSSKPLTVVPGFQFHGAVIGVAGSYDIKIAEHRTEFGAVLDAYPVGYYIETPDNPGRTSYSSGAHGGLSARFDVYGGFCVEARAQASLISVTYKDEGSRNALVGNQVERMQGGTVANTDASITFGAGYLF